MAWLTYTQYIRLPPPFKPYVLRFTLQPGTDVTRNGVLKSDFPMDGGRLSGMTGKSESCPPT